MILFDNLCKAMFMIPEKIYSLFDGYISLTAFYVVAEQYLRETAYFIYP